MTIFLQTLKAQHFLDNIHITIAQIGSRKLSGADDYSSQSWGIFAPNLTIYGFEADADECKRMNQNLKERNISHQEKHIPIALSNTQGKSQLYVTKDKACSSLYEPNGNYASRFRSPLPEFLTLDYVSEIETTTLDSFCASELIDTIDFLQVDVQGAELNIFQGAQQIIKNSTLAIQTEVEFAPLYKNQPLFADVDSHLRQQGFFLQELKELVWMSKKSFPGLGYNKTSLPPELKAGVPQHFSGQPLWGDAFYFQDLLSQPSPVSPEKLLKQACIADILYFPDYALELLEYLTLNYGSNPQYNFTEVINIGLSILKGNTSNNVAELTIPQSNIPNQGSAAQHKLKIGYVSPDFKRHPVGKFIAPIIKHHDHQKFEIYCYGEIRKVDEITEEIQSSCDHWRSTLGLTDAEVIEQIKQDQIDILIDLAGHTEDNRLPIFFSKPAPIQASYLGYFATTGIPTIDYWITDHHLHPADTEEKTSETIWRLPRCYVAYQPSPEALEVNPLPALSSEYITFGCLNNFSKLNPFLLSLWAKILQALPQSRLILKSHYHNLDDPEEKQSVELFLQEQGFNLEQVELIDSPTLAEDYFALYHRIDIHLDTFPYNGCTTTCDALWMGVPVLTLAGDRKIQRMGNSLLQAIGLEDWIAHTPEEYVNKAITFAQDLEAIAELRTSLRERFQKSQLGDIQGLTLALENAYQQMWKKSNLKHNLLNPEDKTQRNIVVNKKYLTTMVDLSSSEKAQNKCKICGSHSYHFANADVLQKYDVTYFQCSNCKFIQTEEPYWLEEAYGKVIASSDVGLVYRNIAMAEITSKLLFNFFDHNASFLDYGGGYGLFVRLMRDKGFNFYWEDKYCQNLFAQEFEFNSAKHNKILLTTAFELFEHFVNPVQEIEKILKISPNILFSTQLLPENNPKPSEWWYFTPHEGQHISIFTKQSLAIIAQKYNLNFYTDGSSLHLLTDQIFPEDIFQKILSGDISIPDKGSLLSSDYQKVVGSILGHPQPRSEVLNPDSSPLVDGTFSENMMSKKYKIGNHNIYLPSNHKLDQYQQTWKLYDRVLGIIAHYVLIKYPQTTAIDIGANIGDTAALIQQFQPIPTLCIEGNPEYLPYLEQNARIIGNIEIANSFIGRDGEIVDLNNISSKGGTTSVLKAIGGKGNNTSIMQSLASLLKKFSKFQNSKLLKIDTDGFDFEIIIDSQEIIKKLKPIIYFEYDISFSFEKSGISNALNTVNILSDLGYEKFMLFDNFGNHLCSISSNDKNYLFDLTSYLFSNLYKSGQPAVYYFDICAFHFEDISIFESVYNNLNQDLLKRANHQKSASSILEQNQSQLDVLHHRPVIMIDGVFFQMYSTGIARVWRSLLEEWSKTDFAKHILVLDRGGNTAPKIEGIRYRAIPLYDYDNTEADKQMLQEVCNQENADLFISTYYTTPLETPSIFMAYDMIPEVIGARLDTHVWREKHHAIRHACGYISISGNTADDLSRLFTGIDRESITVAHCGVASLFSPASQTEKDNFKFKYGIHKPYFLLGNNLLRYKNVILFFKAFQELANRHNFDLVCTGSGIQLPGEWRQYTSGCVVHNLYLTDDELRIAYSAAIALVYPSKYEGFGMPIIEAMACGCPVITTRNASIPEVAGNAALYVGDDDIEGMADALYEVQKPRVRRSLIQRGLIQAQKFSWNKMASIVREKLLGHLANAPITVIENLNNLSSNHPTLNYYAQYVQKLCPQVNPQTVTKLISFDYSCNWEQPSRLEDYNNIAVICLIEAEETQDLSVRKQLLNNAVTVLEKGKDYPLCAAHLALVYGLIGEYRQGYNLANFVLKEFKKSSIKDSFTKGLIYLPPTSHSLFRQQGNLERLLAAENADEQVFQLCIEALYQSSLAFYSDAGYYALTLASEKLINFPILDWLIGIVKINRQLTDGVAFLEQAQKSIPNHPPSIQALYLAYRNLPEAKAAEYWLQQGVTHFNPNSPDVGEWIWTQVKPENPFTYVLYDNLILTVEANLKSITTAVLLAQGDWFEAEMELWRIQIRPDMTVIDVGANVGVYTFSAAQRVGETGKVIAIEPFKDCVNCLQETSRINQLPWVKIYEAAASDHCGSAKLSLYNASELNEVISDNSPSSDSANTVTIQCLTLDSLIETENLTRVDWLKIDAEGHEIQVLQGAERLLTEFKPNIIYENIAGAHGSNGAIMEYIQAKGYQVYSYRPYIQELVPVTDANQLNSQLNLIAVYNPNK